MKKTIIYTIIITITGLLITLGPFYIFKACAAGCCAAYPECFWMTKFVHALGVIITALGVFHILYTDAKTQLGMSIGIFLTGIMALLSVRVIFGGCDIKSMECNLVTIPALTALTILVILISGIKLYSLRK